MAEGKSSYILRCTACDFQCEASTSAWAGVGLTHTREMGGKESGHRVVLASAESGKPVLDKNGNQIATSSRAVQLGLMEKRKDGSPLRTQTSQTQRGRIKEEIVDLDSRIRFLYEWDCLVTSYDGNFAEWIFDCIMGFHVQNRQKLRFDILFAGEEHGKK